MTTVRRAMLFSFIESYLGITLNLVSFILLARLLTPQQVGLFSVALALISITQVIRDFGLVNFLIQKKDLGAAHISTAWGMALILGTVLFVLIQLGAPLIGNFYEDQSLTSVARIIAFNFLLLPFNSVCLALLRREMQFSTVMRINLSAAFLSTVLTVTMAWAGFGAYALAIGAVLNNTFVAIGIGLVGAASRLRAPGLQEWREILSFGGPLTVANVVTSVSIDINDLAVGKIMGFQAVAIASRAQGLMNLFHRDFMSAIRNVAYPAFSRAVRDGESVERKFTGMLANVTALAWPFYGFAALFPLEVLRMMFGPQWDQSAPLVPVFCLAGALSAMVSLVPTVMMSSGRSKLVATAELVIQPIKAVTLCLVVYHYRDLMAFALAFLAVAFIQVPFFYWMKQFCLPTDLRALAALVARNLGLAAFTLAPAAGAVLAWRTPGQAFGLAPFLGCAAATAVCWLLGLFLFRHALSGDILAVLRARWPRLGGR